MHGLGKTGVSNATRINVNFQSVSYQLDGVTCGLPFSAPAPAVVDDANPGQCARDR
jgi:hypothetical protein